MDVGRIYRTLLRLYPSDYRSRFAPEMLHVFEHALEEHRRQSVVGYIRFLIRECRHLLTGAGREWTARLTTDASVRLRWSSSRASLPDEVAAAEERTAMLVDRMVHAIANHDFPAARRYAHEEREARDELCRLRAKHHIAEHPCQL